MEKVKKVVRHLRNKPEKERRHILNLSMFVVVGFMFVLWVVSLGVSFNEPEEKKVIKESLKPFSVLKSNLLDGYNSISGEENAPIDVIE